LDESASNTIERAKLFADFDHARNDFIDMYAQMPDESLGWMPEGDDYSIGYILIHVAGVLTQYTGLVDQIRLGGWGEVHAVYPEPVPLDAEVVRATELAGIEAAHDAFARKARELTSAQFEEQADVYFPDTNEPFPTSVRDIMSWLTDHYNEHIPHLQSLLEGWRASVTSSS
jgi:hypothetical protein